MFITTIRVKDGKVTHTTHLHPADAMLVVWLVRFLFVLCSVLAIGLFAVVYLGDEAPLANAGLTISGIGFVLMAIRLRRAIGGAKEIPTMALKPAPGAQQPSNVMGQRRPDQRNDHQEYQRCKCGARRYSDGPCRNRSCPHILQASAR